MITTNNLQQGRQARIYTKLLAEGLFSSNVRCRQERVLPGFLQRNTPTSIVKPPWCQANENQQGHKRALTNVNNATVNLKGEPAAFLQGEELSLLMSTKIPSDGLGGLQVSPSG
jgi:hypothetical protein